MDEGPGRRRDSRMDVPPVRSEPPEPPPAGEPLGPSVGRRILMNPLTRILIAILVMIATVAPLAQIPGLTEGLLALYGIQVVAAFAALFVVGRFIEMRTPAEFGMGNFGAGRDMMLGFAIGGAIFGIVVGFFALAGWYDVVGFGPVKKPEGILSTSLPWRAVEILLFFLLVGAVEEVLFRGLILRVLQDGIGTWAALVVSSVLFGWVHVSNPGADIWDGAAIALEAGILLGGAFILTRSLWMPIGIHWGWNFFEGPVFGTSVSGTGSFDVFIRAKVDGPELMTGGAFGPEGGLVALFVATGAGIAIVILAARRRRFLRPGWAQKVS